MSRVNFTKKDLAFGLKRVECMPLPISIWQLHFPVEIWKSPNMIIKWTDEELNAADKETGFIGNRNGVNCYIYPNPASRKFLMDTLNGLRK